jgi:hypothetical protein
MSDYSKVHINDINPLCTLLQQNKALQGWLFKVMLYRVSTYEERTDANHDMLLQYDSFALAVRPYPIDKKNMTNRFSVRD